MYLFSYGLTIYISLLIYIELEILDYYKRTVYTKKPFINNLIRCVLFILCLFLYFFLRETYTHQLASIFSAFTTEITVCSILPLKFFLSF